MDNDIRKIASGSSFVFFGRVIEAILLLLVNLLAARLFSLEAYGDFTFLFALMTIIALLTRLGIDQGIMSFLPSLHGKYQKKAWGMILFALIIVVVVNLLTLLAIYIVSKNSLLHFLIGEIRLEVFWGFLPFLILQSLINTLFGIFRSVNKFKVYIVIKSILLPSLIIICLVITKILGFPSDITNITVSYYIGFITANLCLVIVMVKDNFRVVSTSNVFNNENKLLLKFSMPLLLSGILSILISRTDQVMIGAFLDNKFVGIYNIIFQISILMSFVLNAFNTIFAPKINILYRKKELDKLENLYKTFTRWITIITSILFVNVLVSGQYLLGFFGEEFKVGYVALVLMASGQLVNAAVGSVGYMNTMTGRPKYELYTNGLTLIINYILNFTLIPVLGINGAAFASFIAVSSTNLIRVTLMYRNLKFHPFTTDYLKLLFAGVISTFGVYLISEIMHLNNYYSLFVSSMVGTSVFIVVYYLTGLNIDDKVLVNKFMKKYLKSSVSL